MSLSDSTTCRVIRHRSPEYFAALKLRDALLRAPLGLQYSEEDIAAEADSLHIIAERFGEIIATLQLVPLDDGHTMKMRQVVVAENLQGSGVGRALVAFSEKCAEENGRCQIVLHARENVLGFYKSLGYEIEGEGFEEVGLPHRRMLRRWD